MIEPAPPAPSHGSSRGQADIWPGWYRPIVLVGLALSFIVSIAAYVSSGNRAGFALDTALVYLVLPTGIVVSIAASRRYGSRWAFVAAGLLDLAAVLVAARAAIGLAFAVILPFAGLVLVLSVGSARQRRLAFVAAWLATTAGMAIALTIGPVAEVTGLRNVALAVVGGALFVAFVEVHLMLLTELRVRASEAAEAELASRRQAEAELDRTSRLLSAIVEGSPVPTQAFDTRGTAMIWNPASERVFGWTRDEVVGSRMPAAMTPEDERASSQDRIRRTMGGEVIHGDRVRRLAKDGHELWVDIYAAPLLDRDGHTIGIAGQLVDVTGQIALEGRLRQSERMDAIGRLSGGIAHDFNNMLTAIRGNAELLRDGLGPEQEAMRTDVDQILDAADRAGNLTRQLLAFARRAPVEPRVVDPTEVIRDFAPMLARLIGVHVRLTMDLAPDTGSIRVDRGQLEQVILNLALNARDAMPDGGTLRIATANEGQAYVVLTVTDTGTGMDESVRSRIFEPFFTTKEQGRGTGMGLPTVYGIVRMQEGTIEVASEPDQGTTFTIRLPRVAAHAPAPKPPVEEPLPRGTETILLIEDEPAVRAFASRSLSKLGYAVLEASGDAEAFAYARDHEGTIDLILSDVVLPGTPGPALVRQLVGLRPGTAILLCSGFAPEASVGSDAIDPDRFLAKPYSQASLARAVRGAIDAATGSDGGIMGGR